MGEKGGKESLMMVGGSDGEKGRIGRKDVDTDVLPCNHLHSVVCGEA